MSCNYAEGLSEYHDKGKLGLPEKFDPKTEVEMKVDKLTEWVKAAKHVVVYTGAGISTSAGIPDFRGPKGVWTLELEGKKPEMNVSWDDAQPTATHMALAKLVETDKVKFIVTQNIDGLHLRTGVARSKIAELHGNMFVDQCDKCRCMFVRDSPAPTVGQKYVGSDCPGSKNGRTCRGKLKDFVLDWEAELPDEDLTLSDTHSMLSDLSIVMGSTLQIIPAGNMPTYTKKYQPDNGKLVIINLQPTKQDKKADLSIHTYVDDVMRMLMEKLGLDIPEYDTLIDPVRQTRLRNFPNGLYYDWTQDSEKAREMKKIGDVVHEQYLKKRREEKKRKSANSLNDSCEFKTKKLQKRVNDEDLKDDIKIERNEDLQTPIVLEEHTIQSDFKIESEVKPDIPNDVIPVTI